MIASCRKYRSARCCEAPCWDRQAAGRGTCAGGKFSCISSGMTSQRQFRGGVAQALAQVWYDFDSLPSAVSRPFRSWGRVRRTIQSLTDNIVAATEAFLTSPPASVDEGEPPRVLVFNLFQGVPRMLCCLSSTGSIHGVTASSRRKPLTRPKVPPSLRLCLLPLFPLCSPLCLHHIKNE